MINCKLVLPIDQKAANAYPKEYVSICNTIPFNPQAPVAQKISDEVVFRRFKGKESSFFKSDLTDPPPYSLSYRIREKTMFIHTNQPLITSFYTT